VGVIGQFRHVHYDVRTGRPLKPRRERERKKARPGEMESLCCNARAAETTESYRCIECGRECEAELAA
jgi:hypothetical protein